MARLLGSFLRDKRVTTRCEFTLEGVPTDPTSIECLVQSPSGTVITYESPDVVRESLGVYSLALTLDEEGTWAVKWVGEGDVEAIDEGVILADASFITGVGAPAPGATALTVRREGVQIGQRSALNFHEGANVSISATDDSGTGEVDVTISAVGGAHLLNSHTASGLSVGQYLRAQSGTTFDFDEIQDVDLPVSIQRTVEKNAASGYVGLDAGTLVPTARMASGTASSSSVLYGDRVWRVPPSLSIISVKDPAYGATGDGATDDRTAIQAAVTAAAALPGATVYFPPGTYRISKYIYVNGADDLTFTSEPGVILLHDSADVSVIDDATTMSNNEARSYFLVNNSDRVTFTGLTWQGNLTESDFNTLNLGVAIKARNSADIRVENCTYLGGAGLFNQDANADDTGARIINNTLVAWRGNLTVGHDALVAFNRFHQSTASSYDRVSGILGSSHAVYIFAGRSNVRVIGNTFKNVRTDSVKISGSNAPDRNFIVANNTFENCGGGVEFGDDGSSNPEHANLVVTGNTFWNVGNCVTGYTNNFATRLLGCKSATIKGNAYYYTRDAVTVSGVKAVQVARHNSTSSPVESVAVEDNSFVGLLGAGFATGPTTIMIYCVDLSQVGEGALGSATTLRVAGNRFHSVASVAIQATRCVHPIVEQNQITNVQTPVILNGNRYPVFRLNTLIPGSATSTNPPLRLWANSFPVVYDNTVAGRLVSAAGQSWGINDNNDGSTAVDFPLLGKTGRGLPAQGRNEVVFAYGAPDAWTNGDTVVVSGTTYTYQATSPTGAQFNSAAGLISLIDGQADMDAADYGAPWSITTNHIRVRRVTASTTTVDVRITTARPTCGVGLINGTGGSPMFTSARGGQAGSTTQLVVWSPMVRQTGSVTVLPDNTLARSLLQANGHPLVSNRGTTDAGVVAVLDFGANSAGTEEFRWTVN